MKLGPIDAETAARLLFLGIGSKTVVTPRRSLCLTLGKNTESKRIRSEKIRGINEMPRQITRQTLEEIDGDQDKQEEFYTDLERRFGTTDTSGEITAFIFTYTNGDAKEGLPNNTPTETEVEYLCGLLKHLLNDLWVPPIVPELKGTAYLPYLRDFYNQAESYGKVPLVGLIPYLSSLEIRQLEGLFIEHGINYFVMDFAGKNPFAMYGNINQVSKMIGTIERETGFPCFLHAINVPFTRSLWKNELIPARDILLFEMGFNCFGSSHIPRLIPREIAEAMKTTTRHYRLFNRRDYGYYREDRINPVDFEESVPTEVSLTDFEPGMVWKDIGEREKLFNVERQGLESDTIRMKLIEGESLRRHLRTKAQITPAIMRKITGITR